MKRGDGRKRVAILISGRGSNMSALIEAAGAPDFPGEIVCVISDRPQAAGLTTARDAGVEAVAVDQKRFSSREAHEAEIERHLQAAGAEIVCLAGYMRLLTPGFVASHMGRMINIHPSLLPLFPGLHTHEKALAAGLRIHGCTVHYVTPEMDEGPIIAQAAIPVLAGDTPDSLAQRLLAAEHRLYPHALRMICEEKVSLVEGRSVLTESGIASDSLLIAPPAP